MFKKLYKRVSVVSIITMKEKNSLNWLFLETLKFWETKQKYFVFNDKLYDKVKYSKELYVIITNCYQALIFVCFSVGVLLVVVMTITSVSDIWFH